MKRRIFSAISLCLIAVMLFSTPVLAANKSKTKSVTVNTADNTKVEEKSDSKKSAESAEKKDSSEAEEQKTETKKEQSKKTTEKPAKEHTVIFKYGTKQKEFKVKDGESVDPPTDTFVPGYIFVNWTAEAKNVKKDMVILGGYRITLGEPKLPIKTIPYVDSIITTYTTSGLKYNDNKSAGWPIAWETTHPDLVMGEEGVTCCVHWYNGMTGELWKTDVCEYGTSLPYPIADPYMEGYEFAGWEGSWVNITEDRTIAAQFNKVFTVTFVDTVSNYPFATQTVTYGKTVDLPAAPSHDGYNFLYYSGNAENIHGDTTLYAVYERVRGPLYEDDWDRPWY